MSQEDYESSKELLRALKALETRLLSVYKPYPKQLDFHNAGLTHRERLLMAGNRNGKTHSGAAETAMHTTGVYPTWWKGRKYTSPVRAWACGLTNEKMRDVVQRKLFGPVGHFGTGFIPASCIENVIMSRGMPGAVDYAEIKHTGGGLSWLSLKSYEQGWEKFASDDIDLAWLDEEPPMDVYNETLARTIDREGIVFITFTPLQGMTDVVSLFWPDPSTEDRHTTQMTIEDALHIPEHRREAEIKRFPIHERKARAMGIPKLGSGPVFPVDEDLLREEVPKIPNHWARIAGIDLGYDHPTAVVWLAWDRDADVVHLYDCYKQREALLSTNASAVKGRGAWIPVAWPHDAYRHVQDLHSCKQIAELYRSQGVNMLPAHATFEHGGFGVNAGVEELLERMQTGRFRVATHLDSWFAEMRSYHRKDGKIVPKNDDLMSATRYAVMMLRFAETNERNKLPTQTGMEYDPLNPTAIRMPSGAIQPHSGYDPLTWRH